jgi:flagellin-like hook-associated protein FlgL
VEDPAGGSFLIAKTAREVFDVRNADDTYAEGNVFAALQNLQTALANNSTADFDAAISGVRDASEYMNRMLAFYGTVQNRIQDATDYASRYAVQMTSEISQKQDADVAAAAVELAQSNTQLQATLTMHSKLPRTSLFDFLG